MAPMAETEWMGGCAMTRQGERWWSAGERRRDGGATVVRRAAMAETGELQNLLVPVMKFHETGLKRFAVRRGSERWRSATVGQLTGGESTEKRGGGLGLSPSSTMDET